MTSKCCFVTIARTWIPFFMYLQAFTGVSLPRRNSLIVFDEVQRFPPAREFIKQLVADGRYDYLETGSLISIRRNVEGASSFLPRRLHFA